MSKEYLQAALRDPTEGFKQEAETVRHYSELAIKVDLPEELKPIQNSLEWPIDMSDPNLHICGYYGVRHLVLPEYPWLHFGIDVQAKPGTPVYAPINSVLQYLRLASNSEGKLHNRQAEVGLFSKKLGIVIHLAHLAEDSIPKSILEDERKFHSQRGEITEGELIGKVGKWPNLIPSNIPIPTDVEKHYGRRYDHLHIGVYYDKSFLSGINSYDGKSINPLLLFRRLY